MASSSQSERKGLKEDQETESSISKTIQRVGRGGDVDVELGLDGGARGEGLADERSFRRTSRDKVFSSSSLFLRLSQRPFYPGERLKASTTKYQVLGTSRYLLSVERQTCWKSQCTLENGTMGRPLCKPRFLIVACQANQNVKAGLVSQRFSKIVKDTTPSSGLKLAVLLYSCLTRKTLAEESMINISSTQFSISYGQTLTTSTFVGETLFSLLIVLVGLVLFAHLIGNMPVLCGHLYLYCLRCVQVECLCGRCHRYLSLRRRVMGRRVLTSTAQDVDVSPAAIAFASVEMEI
ncbi:hypothetical protein MUK42_33308 [Musa troglodytarum]|uniref:Uncharacterized protein n=1 Tax=Musa troglodytarum TaxID=320322 RepID=A0A9E7I8A2_9LILI|nr:hypothetical protein MUK42_33308 [Musa troglodytarum]